MILSLPEAKLKMLKIQRINDTLQSALRLAKSVQKREPNKASQVISMTSKAMIKELNQLPRVGCHQCHALIPTDKDLQFYVEHGECRLCLSTMEYGTL